MLPGFLSKQIIHRATEKRFAHLSGSVSNLDRKAHGRVPLTQHCREDVLNLVSDSSWKLYTAQATQYFDIAGSLNILLRTPSEVHLGDPALTQFRAPTEWAKRGGVAADNEVKMKVRVA